jgi:hypothetical protein
MNQPENRPNPSIENTDMRYEKHEILRKLHARKDAIMHKNDHDFACMFAASREKKTERNFLGFKLFPLFSVPPSRNVRRVPLVASSGFAGTRAGHLQRTQIAGGTAKLILLLFTFLIGMQTGVTIFAGTKDVEVKKQSGWEECCKKMQPSSINYIGVFVFIPGLADLENSIQSLNLTHLRRGSAFAEYSSKEEKKGTALIFEEERGAPDRKAGMVNTLLVKDGYYLCNITEFLPGSVLHYEHQVIIRVRKEKIYDRGSWKEMEVMEKIADVEDAEELSPSFVMAIIKGYEHRKSNPDAE